MYEDSTVAPGYGTAELEAVNLGRELLMTRVLAPPNTHISCRHAQKTNLTHMGGGHFKSSECNG